MKKKMKIAFLGASQSGKTVYFSAVYYRFRNSISLPPLTDQKRHEYATARVDKQMGFGLKVSSLALEAQLAANGKKLMQRPITEADWPAGTLSLDKTDVNIRFDFAPVVALKGDGFNLPEQSTEQSQSYYRDIEIYDPPGEVFWGIHENSTKIVDQLLTCDVAVAFVPADLLFDAGTVDVDENEWQGVLHSIAFIRMVEIVEDLRKKLGTNDTYPLCFVLSKADCVFKQENAKELINTLFYERLLVQVSRLYPRLLICGCPISVRDPDTHNFRAMNLEWPFLFAVGGTLMRNYQELKSTAHSAYEKAASYEAKAEELEALRRQSPWLRFRRWWSEDFETAGDNRRAARSYVTEAGRQIHEAEDDQRLAKDIWSTIAVEGSKLRGMRVLMGGKDIADIRIGAL